VPNFDGVRRNSVTARWTSAGFTGSVTFLSGSGNYTVHYQSLVAGSSQPCDTAITVGP
jgi:hypothetical protein